MAGNRLKESLPGLWAEESLDRAVKIQDLLLVALGLRPASLLLLPRSLPEADALGSEIDRVYSHAEERGYLPGAPGWRRPIERVWRRVLARTTNPLRYRSSLAREAFRIVVGRSPGYGALKRWAQELGLERVETAVRPTIDEVYLVADESTVPRLRELVALRRQIRIEAAARLREGEAASLRAFPEERDERFLDGLGRMLGYPGCCVTRYTGERVAGLNVEERASAQLQSALPGGRFEDAAYFTRDFFPCQPDCPRAAAKGAAALRLMESLERDTGISGIRGAYTELLKENRRTVLKYPEIIRQHERKMAMRVRDKKENGGGGRNRG